MLKHLGGALAYRTCSSVVSFLVLSFFLIPSVFAQTPTVVSGQVKDSNGVPYSFAKVAAQLVGIPPSQTATILVNGIPVQIGGQQNANADVNGNFSMNLFCNSAGGGCSVISPSGTQWQFTINTNGAPPPLGTGPQSCIATLTITGASQVISSSFSACPALSNPPGVSTQTQVPCASSLNLPISASTFTDFFINLNCNVTSSQITGTPATGQEAVVSIQQDSVGNRTWTWPVNFLNVPVVSTVANATTVATFQFCGPIGVGNVCPANSWQNTDVGPSGVALNATNQVVVSTNCGSTPSCFQVNANVQVSTNGSWANSSSTVSTNAQDPAFLSTVCTGGSGCTGTVNYTIFGTSSCTGDVSRCTYSLPQGTITSFISAHSVGVSTTTTAATSATANANNVAWGLPDGTTLVSAWNALFPFTGTTLIPQPTKSLSLTCGIMFADQPLFIVPATATHGGGIKGCDGAGGTVIIYLPRANCNATSSGGGAFPTRTGCGFVNGIEQLEANGYNLAGWTVRDITFWQLGTNVKDAAATITNGAAMVSSSWWDVLVNVWVIGWLWNDSTDAVIGMQAFNSTWLNSGSVAGGFNPCKLGSFGAGTVMNMSGGTCGGAFGSSLTFGGGQVATRGTYWNQSFGSHNVVNANTTWFGTGDYLTQDYDSTGGTAYFNGTILDQFGGGNSTLTISSGIVHLNNVQFKASGGAINQTGGTIYDNCGNGVLPGTAPVITNLFGDCSITGVADTPAKHVLSAGFGTTATVTAVGGSVTTVTFTINSSGTGQAASPTITDTFATPFWGTPSAGCSLTQTGGTFAVLTNPLSSSLSRTGVTWTFTGTPVAGQSYIFQRVCRNS